MKVVHTQTEISLTGSLDDLAALLIRARDASLGFDYSLDGYTIDYSGNGHTRECHVLKIQADDTTMAMIRLMIG